MNGQWDGRWRTGSGASRKENMATLNIKNVPDSLYRKLQARAKRGRRSVAQEVIHILSLVTEQSASLSILDLQGLGKGVWRGTEGARHVARERRGWS